MDEPRGERFECPQCAAAFYYLPPGRKSVFCTCGHVFLEAVNRYEVTDDPAPWASRSPSTPAKIERAPVVKKVSAVTANVPQAQRAKAHARVASVRLEPKLDDGFPLADLLSHDPAAGVTTDMPAHIEPAAARAAPVPLETLYGTRLRPRVAELPQDDSLWRDGVVPTALFTASCIAWLARTVAVPPGHLTTGQAVAMALCEMVLTIAIAVVGGLAAIQLLGNEIGPLARAIFKVAAMAMVAGAAASITLSIAGPGARFSASLLSIHEVFLIYAILIRTLFVIDLTECLIVAVVMLVLQTSMALVVWSLA